MGDLEVGDDAVLHRLDRHGVAGYRASSISFALFTVDRLNFPPVKLPLFVNYEATIDGSPADVIIAEMPLPAAVDERKFVGKCCLSR